MQQLQMISQMKTTVNSMPRCVQLCLKTIQTIWNFITSAGNKGNQRRSYKEDKRNNCQITGASTSTAEGLWQDKRKSLPDFDNTAHIRLPDTIIRLIRDKYRDLE